MQLTDSLYLLYPTDRVFGNQILRRGSKVWFRHHKSEPLAANASITKPAAIR